MKYDKQTFIQSLHKSYDIKEKDTTETDPANQQLTKIFDKIVGEDYQTPDPSVINFENIIAKAEKTNTVNKKYLRPIRSTRSKTFWSLLPLAAAAALVIIIMPRIAKPEQTSTFALKKWQGSPNVFAENKKIALQKGKLPAKTITFSTSKKETLTAQLNQTKMHIAALTAISLPPVLGKIGVMKTKLTLQKGLVAFSIQKQQFNQFAIKIPHGEVIVRGTIFSINADQNETKVAVLKGRVGIIHKQLKEENTLTNANGIILHKDKVVFVKNISKNKKFASILKQMITLGYVPKPKKVVKIVKTPKKIRKVYYKATLFIRDGSLFTGYVFAQDSNIIKIRTSVSEFTIPMKNIRRIVYIKNAKARIFLTSGSSITGTIINHNNAGVKVKTSLGTMSYSWKIIKHISY